MKVQAKCKNRIVLTMAGVFAPLLVWIVVKHLIGVTDRFLPAPSAVLQAVQDIQPNVWIHLGFSSIRLLLGYVLGVTTGIALALMMIRSGAFHAFFTPMLQSFRVIPAAAMVPFFLLWFGFSEWGRYLLVVTAVSFNIAIAAWQILETIPENHKVFFHSFQLNPSQLLLKYCLPRIIESLLPTLRFSLALAVGAVTVSELLGSQVGLGYLIQTSRSTFSLHVLFLVAILLGIMSALADGLLVYLWRNLIFWKKRTL